MAGGGVGQARGAIGVAPGASPGMIGAPRMGGQPSSEAAWQAQQADPRTAQPTMGWASPSNNFNPNFTPQRGTAPGMIEQPRIGGAPAGGGVATPGQYGWAPPPTDPARAQAQQEAYARMSAGGASPYAGEIAARTSGQTSGAQQGSVFDQSAAALRGATAGTAAGMGYVPQNINPAYVRPSYAGSTGYGSVSAGSQGYNAATAGSQGYTAVGPQAQGYGAAALSPDQVGDVTFSRARAGTASADWLRDTDLDPYYNPYIDNVVTNTLDDVERQRQVQQTYNAARAAKAGAFGGSRQGILEAETNRGFADTAADTAAALRDRGFQTAQQAAMGDIAQQAGISSLNAQMRTQASLANSANSLAASQMNAANQMGVGLANLGFENQSRQFGADAANRAASQYAAARNAAGQFGAQAGNVASMYNAGAYNQAGQFGAQAANTAALANAGYGNQARQFGADARNTANLANAGYGNQASLANQATNFAAQQANQGAGLNAANLRLNAANQMGNLSNLGFNMGRTLNNDMFTQGLLQQGINQQVIDAGRNQYAGFTGAPERALQLPIQALGAAPVPQQQQSSYKPGIFDYLTAGVGAASSLIPLF